MDRCRTLVREIVEEMGLLRRKTDEQRRDLKQQLADVERRMAIWHEAFETHAESADVVLPRLRELKARRDELITTMAKVVPLTAPPSHLYAETTIARFQQTIRDLFLGADQALAKNYLRFLVERIDVSGNELTVQGKTGATVAPLAAGPERAHSATVNPAEVVLTSAGDWLPKRSISRTWKYAKSAQQPAPTPPISARARPVDKIERADRFRSLMVSEGLTRAGLASRLGVSRAWVTKVLGADEGPLKVVL